MGDYARLSDDELLARTADDREAFGELYDRHVRAVLGELRHGGLTTEEALDVTAEVFAAALLASRRHRGGVRGGGGGCPPLGTIYRQIERKGASWHGSSHGADSRTYELLVAGEVEEIRPLGAGDWRILMTPPWTPDAPGARPLRLVVAIDDEDIDFDIAHGAFPRLELVYADGTTRVATFR